MKSLLPNFQHSPLVSLHQQMRWLLNIAGVVSCCAGSAAAFASNMIGLPDHIVAPAAVLRLGLSSVGDEVSYSPNLPGGGFAAPTKRPRYYGKQLTFSWDATASWHLHGGLQQQSFTSLRDSFSFNKLSIGARYQLPAILPLVRTHLEFGVSANRAGVIGKNSYTPIEDNLLTSLQILKPRDFLWHTSVSQTKAISSGSQITFFTGFGQISSGHSGVSGQVRDIHGCNYDFDFGNSGGEINQLGDCGNIKALNRIYPNDESVRRELGVAPRSDMQNNAWFYRFGGGLSIKRQRWTGQIAYYYQQYLRDGLDGKILASGREIHAANQVLSLQSTHRVSSALSLSASVQYNQHRFLDEVPALYTLITSSRFSNDVVYFSVGANYAFSR